MRVKNGRRLELGILTPNSSAQRHQYAVLLQEAFRRVGAAAKLDETDFATYVAKQSSHAFDTEMVVYVTDPSPSGFKQSWSTAGIAKEGSNFPSYSNPAVDALLDSATTSFDPARTRSYARRAFELIIDDAPASGCIEPPRWRASTGASAPRRCGPTATGRTSRTGRSRRRSARRATGSASRAAQ